MHHPATPRAVALAALAFLASLAHAQSAAPAAAQASAPAAAEPPADAASAPKSGGLDLQTVVVTGGTRSATKMQQSLSVSTLDGEQLSRTGATSAAELLRSIPGVRSESSGGEGNANLTVRGVPISAGGARYVQFQENGLPVLLFGDIAFGTADEFLRADYMTDRIEVVRGGSASTAATNAPGGLVNFISKTGRSSGGDAGVTLGLGHQRSTRVDFDYGGPLGRDLRLQLGGFQRSGRGTRDAGMDTEEGGQFRGNLTQSFSNGWLQVDFKRLDDITPTYLPVPVTVSNGKIQAIPGVDPRTAYFITPHLPTDTVYTRDGTQATFDTRDGLHVRSNAIGLQGHIDLGQGFTVDEKFRRSQNSGRFIGMFPADNGNGGTTPFTGTLFDTSLDDLGNLFNELRLTRTLALGTDKLQLQAGLFTGTQNVAETWFWNQYRLTMQGHGALVVDLSGAPTTQPVTSGWDTWGGCCDRTFDVKYAQTSPFASLAWDHGPLSLDLSLRRDQQQATGWFESGNATTKTWDASTRKVVDYTVGHTSWSAGANFMVDPSLAVFGRASDGVAYSADRLLYGKPVDGTVPIDINEVRQFEGGVKWRHGGFSSFVTVFDARTNESNFEATTQTFTHNRYAADGVELEAGYRMGDFRVNGGATWTHARITATADGSGIGNMPRRQARLTWQLSPAWSVGDWELGAAVVGTTKAYGDDANTITMPGYVVFNPYVQWLPNEHVTVMLGANNAFNALGYTEIEGDGHAARSIDGRTFRATLKYSF